MRDKVSKSLCNRIERNGEGMGISYSINAKEAGSYDVIVCGGGPSGFAAAVSAARCGAKTLIIERNGCLGGIWTAGLLSWILDFRFKYKGTILGEIFEELEALKAGKMVKAGRAFSCDVEEMKHYLEQKCLKENVEFRLHTMLTDAILSEDKRRIEGVVTSSKSGMEIFRAKAFVDATGDGDLGAYAGCSFKYGNEQGEAQPMSLIALLCGVKADMVEDMNNSIVKNGNNPKKNLREEMNRAGIEPSYSMPTLMQFEKDGIFALMSNHEYEVSPFDAGEITQATVRARDELYKTVKALKSLGGAWENVRLIATAEQIGVREGRRIEGLYCVTEDDLYAGRHFDDSICDVYGGIDLHYTKSSYGTGVVETKKESKPYQIPMRALIAKDNDSLVMAGRCISGDFYAHSTYRVTGNAVITGAAAGKLAAVSAKMEKPPKLVTVEEFKNFS